MDAYKTRITPEKEKAVKALKDEFSQYDGYIFTEYRGMTVAQITKVRKGLMAENGNYRVVKNHFARIAMKQLEHEGCEKQLKGPTAIAYVKGDTANTTAKQLFAAKDDGAPIVIKGGLIGGKFFTAEELEAYSKLPSRNELLSMLLGTMKAPVQKLAATLLAYVNKNSEKAEGEAKTEEAAPAAAPAAN